MIVDQESKNNVAVSIEGLETENHRISSEILIRVINGFQKIAWILGAASEGKNFDKRFRPPSALKSRHKLDWGILRVVTCFLFILEKNHRLVKLSIRIF
jgi:hypothetical protein